MLLIIDTCNQYCSVGVFDPASCMVVAKRTEDLGRGHAERLMPIVDEVMRQAGMAPGQLTGIGVTRGPGSFTGIRVGLAAARGLALALKIPAVGIGVLPAIARSISSKSANQSASIIVVQDAKRGEAYCQAFDGFGKPANEAVALAIDTIGSWLPRGPLILAGSAAERVFELLDPASRQSLALNNLDRPEITAIAGLALAELAANPPKPTPLYVRGADAKRQTSFAVARTGAT